MKKQTRNKLFAVIAIILIATLTVMPVSASGGAYSRVADTTLDKTTFTKDFKIRNDCNVPASEFTFTVVPGAAIQYDSTKPDLYPVYAGIIPNLVVTPKTGTAVTADAEDTSVAAVLEYASKTKNEAIAGEDDITYGTYTGENYYKASKDVELDFTSVNFTEPGIYRYVITESCTDTTISVDSTPRTLDVYVEDVTSDAGNKLKVTGYVMYQGLVSSAPNKSGDDITTKSKIFTNTFPTASLTFGKEVTGNQGSLDKYFDFTLTLTGPLGAKLNVDLSKAHATTVPNAATSCFTSAVTQVSSITLDNDDGSGKGTKTVHFYLQDGQYISITGLAEGMGYEVSENAEEYTSADGISDSLSGIDKNGDGNKDALIDPKSGEITKVGDEIKSVYTGFTNTKEGVIPTGVILSVAPWAIAGVVILAGVIFFAIRSRRKFEEE